jgi:hypothetical protein
VVPLLGTMARSTGARTINAAQRLVARRKSRGGKLTKRAQYSVFQKLKPSGEQGMRSQAMPYGVSFQWPGGEPLHSGNWNAGMNICMRCSSRIFRIVDRFP